MTVMTSKPKLACSPNGPYALLNDMQAAPVPTRMRCSPFTAQVIFPASSRQKKGPPKRAFSRMDAVTRQS